MGVFDLQLLTWWIAFDLLHVGFPIILYGNARLVCYKQKPVDTGPKFAQCNFGTSWAKTSLCDSVARLPFLWPCTWFPVFFSKFWICWLIGLSFSTSCLSPALNFCLFLVLDSCLPPVLTFRFLIINRHCPYLLLVFKHILYAWFCSSSFCHLSPAWMYPWNTPFVGCAGEFSGLCWCYTAFFYVRSTSF